ncbi:MAG: hypothetical protein JWM47_183 [Acidimicrobiales bacterium]|nr:hypothetical protein [Acidimicrobiales bacterium]
MTTRLRLAILIAGVVAVGGLLATRAGYVLLGLAIIAMPTIVLVRWVRTRLGPRAGSFAAWLTVAKAGATIASFYVTTQVYGGVADAVSYNRMGSAAAAAFWDGRQMPIREIPGTGLVDWILGWLYVPFGANIGLGLLVFAWLGYFGAVLFAQSFSRVLPRQSATRYAAMVFFTPSLLYWTSSISKDAFLVAGLGVATLGYAELTRTWAAPWLVVLGAGLGSVLLVRPHIAFIYLASIVLSMAGLGLAASQKRKGRLVIFLLVFVAATAVAGSMVREFVGVDASAGSFISQSLDQVAAKQDAGRSGFENTVAWSPSKVPWAVVSVLFRPWPWEARNPLMFLSAAEGTLLMLLCARRLLHLKTLTTAILKEPLLALSAAYVVLFCVAFSVVGNFGVLVRQRIQVLPFLLILALVPIRDDGDDLETAVSDLRDARTTSLGA